MKSVNSDETIKEWNDKDDFTDISSIQGKYVEAEVDITEADSETESSEPVPENFVEPEVLKG